MEQYIPKSVVLTEIEKRLHKYKKNMKNLLIMKFGLQQKV